MEEFDFKHDIFLENERACLEPLEPAHFDALKDIILSDKELMRYSPMPLQTETDLRYYFDIAFQNRYDKVRYPFAVFDKQTNTYAGSTSFCFIFNHDRRLELGFTWIGRQYHGTGLNTAMKYLMLKYAFDNLGFCRVEFKTDVRNQQSRNAIQKLGATYEGEFRSHMTLPDGQRRNSVYYSITSDDWPTIKKERFSTLINEPQL